MGLPEGADREEQQETEPHRGVQDPQRFKESAGVKSPGVRAFGDASRTSDLGHDPEKGRNRRHRHHDPLEHVGVHRGHHAAGERVGKHHRQTERETGHQAQVGESEAGGPGERRELDSQVDDAPGQDGDRRQGGRRPASEAEGDGLRQGLGAARFGDQHEPPAHRAAEERRREPGGNHDEQRTEADLGGQPRPAEEYETAEGGGGDRESRAERSQSAPGDEEVRRIPRLPDRGEPDRQGQEEQERRDQGPSRDRARSRSSSAGVGGANETAKPRLVMTSGISQTPNSNPQSDRGRPKKPVPSPRPAASAAPAARESPNPMLNA